MNQITKIYVGHFYPGNTRTGLDEFSGAYLLLDTAALPDDILQLLEKYKNDDQRWYVKAIGILGISIAYSEKDRVNNLDTEAQVFIPANCIKGITYFRQRTMEQPNDLHPQSLKKNQS